MNPTHPNNPNPSHRVFITGLSALTACGEDIETNWQALLAGQTGIAEIKLWDLSSWSCRLGGELKNYQPARMLPDKKLLKMISRQDVLGIYAAVHAIEHSQMLSFRDAPENAPDLEAFNESTAIFVGSPGNKFYQQYDFLPLLAKTNDNMHAFAEQLFAEVHPMWLLRILPNNVLAYTGITYGFKGVNHNIANHAVSGTQALIEAYHAIHSGQAERAVVVAYDVGIEPQALFYYDKLGVISPRHLKPFDVDHDGTILAEGAAALVLESEAAASARSASCYAELLGGCSSSETKGLFSLDASGRPLAELLKKTIDACNLNAAEIEMIVAHGNGNKISDESEALAIQQHFSTETPVTGFKWATGHTLAASGLVDAVLTAYALKNRCVPGIASFNTLAPHCAGINVSNKHRAFQQKETSHAHHALMISRGFASMNACVAMKSCV